MQRSVVLSSLVVALTIGSATPVSAQSDSTAATVEVLGLRRWTVAMLTDSIRRYRPDVQLGDAACGEVLRDSLRFEEAAVLRFRDGRVVIMVVEPWDTGRVVVSSQPLGTTQPPGPWHDLAELIRHHDLAVDIAVQTYRQRQDFDLAELDSSMQAPVRSAWVLIEVAADPVHRAPLRVILSTASDPALRRAAASMLVNHDTADVTWWALMDALRDPDWSVRGAAMAALRSLRTDAPRHIDWRPATTQLRALLAGTALVYHVEVQRTLTSTEIDPALAAELLSPGAALLLRDQLGARHEYVSQNSMEFLVHLVETDDEVTDALLASWLERFIDPGRVPDRPRQPPAARDAEARRGAYGGESVVFEVRAVQDGIGPYAAP